jgi:hypothetical protein
MKLQINLKSLQKNITALNNQSVTVGIISDTPRTAASIDFNQDIRTVSSADAQAGIDSAGLQSYKSRHPKAKGRSKNPSLKKLGAWLDEKKGVFSDAMQNANNKDVIAVLELLSIMDKTPRNIRQLETASRAIVRNPILRGDYNPNSAKWAKKKGFDHWGIATGTFFNNIKAKYETW